MLLERYIKAVISQLEKELKSGVVDFDLGISKQAAEYGENFGKIVEDHKSSNRIRFTVRIPDTPQANPTKEAEQ